MRYLFERSNPPLSESDPLAEQFGEYAYRIEVASRKVRVIGSMIGETNLATLLRTLKPVLQQGTYVFCSLPEPVALPAPELLGSFREAEGVTVILRQEAADRLGLPYPFVAAWLTLQVHSSLAAVGLTAAVAQALAAQRISCNVVAAYHHDHLFVDHADAARALAVLEELAHRHGADEA
jgi:hypothetical protein